MKRKLLISAAILIAAMVLPDVLTAQPLPGGGPGGGGGVAGAPIDPASWLIPAGMVAYHKYKQYKKAKQEDKDSEG